MKPPLMREHRLYQADWLMRFYGFAQARDPRRRRRRHARPRDRPEARLGAAQPRRCSRSTSTAPTARCCCACPASAPRSVKRILETRRYRRLRLEDVGRLCQSIAKVRPFIVAEGWSPGGTDRRSRACARRLVAKPRATGAVLIHASPPSALSGHTSCTSPARPISPAGATPRGGWRLAERRAGGIGDLAGRVATGSDDLIRVGRRCPLAGVSPSRSRCRAPSSTAPRPSSAIPTPSASPCSTACCWRLRDEPDLLKIASDPDVAASRRWRSRCAATSTRCAPSCASGRSATATTSATSPGSSRTHFIVERNAPFLRAPLHRHALDDPDAARLGALGRRDAGLRPGAPTSATRPAEDAPKSCGAPISRTSSIRRG